MSNTVIVNTRVDLGVKRQAQKLADELGFSLSSLFRAFLKQLIRKKSISFSISEQPSDHLLKALKESKKDIKGGYTSRAFDNAEDAIDWLNDPKAKYENQIQQEV